MSLVLFGLWRKLGFLYRIIYVYYLLLFGNSIHQSQLSNTYKVKFIFHEESSPCLMVVYSPNLEQKFQAGPLFGWALINSWSVSYSWSLGLKFYLCPFPCFSWNGCTAAIWMYTGGVVFLLPENIEGIYIWFSPLDWGILIIWSGWRIHLPKFFSSTHSVGLFNCQLLLNWNK